jgi:hypothetical protein
VRCDVRSDGDSPSVRPCSTGDLLVAYFACFGLAFAASAVVIVGKLQLLVAKLRKRKLQRWGRACSCGAAGTGRAVHEVRGDEGSDMPAWGSVQ